MEENPEVSAMLNKMKEVLLTNEETNKILENSKRELKNRKDRCNEDLKEVYLSAVKMLEEAYDETNRQMQHKHDDLRERQEEKQKILQRCNLALGIGIVELAGSKCDESSVQKYEDVLEKCREALNMRNLNHTVVFKFIPNPKLKPKLGVLQLCDNLPSDFKLSLLTHVNSIAIGNQVSCAIEGELTKENLQHLEFCIRMDTSIIAAKMTKVEDKMVTFCFRPDSGGVYSVMVLLFGLNIVASPLSVLVPLTNANEDSASNSTLNRSNEESKIMPTPHEINRESASTKDAHVEILNRENSTHSHTGEIETKHENMKQIDEEKNIEGKVTVADVSVSVAEDEVADIEEMKHEELSAVDSNHNRFDEAGDTIADDATWKVGDKCIARWEDDKVWYRAEVKKLQPDGVLVTFIDYGNSAVVTRLVNMFLEIPHTDEYDANVIPTESQDENQNSLKDTITKIGKESVPETADAQIIPIEAGDQCIPIEKDNQAIPIAAGNQLISIEADNQAILIEENNQAIPIAAGIQVISIEADNQAILIEENNQAIPIAADNQAILLAESKFKVGDICIARWEADQIWYNCVVQNILGNGSYLVNFVYYGNSEVVCEPFIVNLVRNANELPTEITSDCVDVHVKIENTENCLEGLKNFEEKPAPKFSEGQTCVARWAQDLVWYNGKIVHDSKDGSYLVEFVDYGNHESVESLYILEDGSKIPITVDSNYIDENVDHRMRGTEIVMKHVSSKDVSNIELQRSSLSSVMKDNIYTRDEGKNAVENSIVEHRAQVKSNIVDVMKHDHDTENVNRQTKKREKSTPAVPRPLKEVPSAVEQTANDISQTQQKNISQTQQKNNISQTREKNVCGQMEVIHAWQPGDNCLALWSEDSVWYNAVINGRNSNGTYTVTFSDYGNEEDVQPDGMVLDHLALIATGKQCVVDVNVKLDAEENRSFNKPFDKHVKKNVQSIEKECMNLLDGTNSASSFGFDSNSVIPSSPNPESDAKPSSLPVEVRNMNGSLNLLEMVTDLHRGAPVIPAKELLHISHVNGPIGISVLRNKNILISSSLDNSVKLFNARGEIIAPIESNRPFKRPSDMFTLSTGEFVVRDDVGLQLFTEEGAFIRHIGQAEIDKCYGVTEDDEGHIVTINGVRASENAKPGSKGKGGVTDVGETDIFYIDRESGSVVKRIEMIDIIQDKSKSKCRFINFNKKNVYIVDLGLDCIYVLDTSGVKALSFGSQGSGKGQFKDPAGLVVDNSGNIIVADSRNHRLQIFNSENEYVGDVQVDRPLNRPSGIYLDKQCKELYVLNYWGNSMTKYRIG